jgi:mRNA-degrading endonuclease RelE of RelBE toxin-antitoxin system
MNWVYELTNDAEQDLIKFHKPIQRKIINTLLRLEVDPFHGDVKQLYSDGAIKIFRRRIGNYRIIFSLDYVAHIIWVLHILLRSEKTYR